MLVYIHNNYVTFLDNGKKNVRETKKFDFGLLASK